MSRAAGLVAAFGLLGLGAAEVFFEEKFQDADWEKRWVHSSWKGPNGPAGKFEWSAGDWFADEAEQKGLRTPANMNYHSISAKLPQPFSNRGKDLVVQLSVKHETKDKAMSFCGGGYIKLLGSDIDQATFGGPTPYKIMFGPDVCGYDIARIHTIFNWKGENLLRKPDIGITYDEKNEFSHLYTLVVRPDNTYAVYFDLKEKASGSLHDNWDFPNKTRDDPEDKKPEDWVHEKRIDDSSVTKPADWVDEKQIRDPSAKRPDEWDDEEDGTWEAPLIENPKYKGAWLAPKIDNPAYKGEWRPRQLGNPDFVEEVYSYSDIGAVGFELWTVNKGSILDNILVCDSWDHAKKEGERLLKIFEKEKSAKEAWDKAKGKASPPSKKKGKKKKKIPDDDDDDDDSETIDMDKKEL